MMASIAIACFILVLSAIACFILFDTINLGGEKHSLSWRVNRYKVAGQFLWFDFKDWVSRRFSEPQSVQCPADPPESEPEPEAEQEPETEP